MPCLCEAIRAEGDVIANASRWVIESGAKRAWLHHRLMVDLLCGLETKERVILFPAVGDVPENSVWLWGCNIAPNYRSSRLDPERIKELRTVFTEELVKEAIGKLTAHCGYSAIVDCFGETAVEVSDDDYQGDTRILYSAPKWGYLQFGWGSCSGCDALEACDTDAEVRSLAEGMADSVIWFDSAWDALDYFTVKHDWEGSYGWYREEQQKFIRQAVERLGDEVGMPVEVAADRAEEHGQYKIARVLRGEHVTD